MLHRVLLKPLTMKEALVVKDNAEEGTVHVQSAVVFQEAQFSELVHEEMDAGPRGADHLGQRFLTDLRNDWFRLACLP